MSGARSAATGLSASGGGVDAPIRVTTTVSIPARELAWRFSRSSGPGGQGVNTADSRAELRWDAQTSATVAALPEAARDRLRARVAARFPGAVVTIVASEHRAQLRNRMAARDRLAQLLREALAPPPRARRATRPTRGSVERRLVGKKVRSATKAGRSRNHDRDV